jgi:tRNA (guanine26-N2/guanine27-N2)-dimethyltransferase
VKGKSVKYAPGISPVVPQKCSDCGKKFNVGGPIWSAPIHDQDWVLSTLANVKAMKNKYPAYNKITSVLTTVSEVLLLLSCLLLKVSSGAFGEFFC